VRWSRWWRCSGFCRTCSSRVRSITSNRISVMSGGSMPRKPGVGF